MTHTSDFTFQFSILRYKKPKSEQLSTLRKFELFMREQQRRYFRGLTFHQVIKNERVLGHVGEAIEYPKIVDAILNRLKDLRASHTDEVIVQSFYKTPMREAEAREVAVERLEKCIAATKLSLQGDLSAVTTIEKPFVLA